MARPSLSKDIANAIIRDWEYGLYTNYTTLGNAHGVSSHTSKKVVVNAKAILASKAEEYEALKNTTKQFILEPTAVNSQKREQAMKIIPITNLFDMEAIAKHTNGLVAKEIMEELEEELINSTLMLISARANHNVRINQKTIAGVTKEGSYNLTVPLDSGDLKNYVELLDKSKIALGQAPRFAPKSDTNVGVQLNTTTDSEGNVITTTSTVSNNINSFYDKSPIAIEG